MDSATEPPGKPRFHLVFNLFLETKAGELSEGEYKYQYQLALGLSLFYDITMSLEEKLLKHFSFLKGKIIKTSWQMKNRGEAPLSFSLYHSLQL